MKASVGEATEPHEKAGATRATYQRQRAAASAMPAPIVSEDAATSAFVYTDKDVYAAGETVVVFWDGTPGNATDWSATSPDASVAPCRSRSRWTKA